MLTILGVFFLIFVVLIQTTFIKILVHAYLHPWSSATLLSLKSIEHETLVSHL